VSTTPRNRELSAGRLPGGSLPTGVDTLVQRLIDEMGQRWREGNCPRAEEFLNRHAELWKQPAAVMDLVYEELFLCHEHRMTVDVEAMARRFPDWRQQIDVLLHCIDALQDPPGMPQPGEVFGDFEVLAELGRGGQGRVYAATQSSLGGRPVVLKITPRRGEEHLSLARLQHTHIVPLLSVIDEPDSNLRVLCMPYFGGMTLAAILDVLKDRPVAQRTGQQILEALTRARAAATVVLPLGRDPATPFLERATYEQTMCWIGACLAEALKYAHDRGLAHLDVKPSNVLLTANHQPMLLDFHLAREPLVPGDRGGGFGGTPAYMSPEQKQAMAAIRQDKTVPAMIDGRSDIYSLGLVLYEALGGSLPTDAGGRVAPLRQCNPRVPLGLSDIIARCLAQDARHRYQDAGALAADLWAHLNDLPLKGVANRNLIERWHKWRRRKPHQLSLVALLVAVLAVSSAALTIALVHLNHCFDEARTALEDGQNLVKKGQAADAVSAFKRGQLQLEYIPGTKDLKRELTSNLQLALRAQLAADLHDIADRFRVLYGADALPRAKLQPLQSPCREFWEKRDLILDRLGNDNYLDADAVHRVHQDLLDLAILGADLKVRLAGSSEAPEARRDALQVLAQAEALFGPNAVLYHERRLHAEALGETEIAHQAQWRASQHPPRTAWEYYAIGRSLLQAGDLKTARLQLDKAVAMQPNGLWPHFHRGVCCYRLGAFEDSALAFTACTSLAPNVAAIFFNRALAFAGSGKFEPALQDLDRALRLDPGLVEAAELARKLRHKQ
jgi:serine/threonine protein kinase